MYLTVRYMESKFQNNIIIKDIKIEFLSMFLNLQNFIVITRQHFSKLVYNMLKAVMKKISNLISY